MFKRLLKNISFGSLALLAVVLVMATVAEESFGWCFYSSPWFVALWGVIVVSALGYIFRTSVFRVGASLFLHLAFVAVLAGAFVTYLTGERGELFICKGAVPSSMFVKDDGALATFPFRITLRGCGADFSEEGGVPSDYFAELSVILPGGGDEAARLSMNRVYDRDGYRFYLSSVNTDCATLLVSHDLWGTSLTYLGYVLSVAGFLALFLSRGTQRAALVRYLQGKGAYFSYNLSKGVWVKFLGFALLFFVVITCLGVCRWMGTGVLPVTNGAEVMMFIAWCSFGVALCLRRRRNLVVAACCLAVLCGVVSLCSGVTSPGAVQPVLRTPLLPLHVVTIVVSYVIIGLLAVNAFVALCAYCLKRDYERLEATAVYGRVMLYLAVLFLVAGIFLGAVWANISWGRYWGWDPKEVWALVTLFVCSFGFHTRSLPFMARPLVFHIFCLVAFVVMLFTYLGVNFLFEGLHSYA